MNKATITSFVLVAFSGAAIWMLSDYIVATDVQEVEVDIVTGESLYDEHCASCHGQNGEGQPDWQTPDADGVLPAPPHDQTGHTWHHGDRVLFDYTKLGGKGALAARGMTDFKSGMLGFAETLTDQEIWNILGFIKSTWPKQAQEAQQQRTNAESSE